MDRRTFIQNTSAAGLAAAMGAPRGFSASADKKTVGIQVGAVSFVDEGVEQVLDTFQNDASVNTLFIATFTYGRGIAGRQVPGQPLPDHGVHAYDTATFHGGCYTGYDAKYFADTVIKDFRAPDLGKFDVLEAVLPSARKRGMKSICWFEDVFRRDVPSIGEAEEVELSGEKAATLCFNNPNYRAWLLGMVENWARTYPIDGIMWGSERQGAFLNMLGASHGRAEVGHVTCFCQYCIAKGRARGIDPDRARQGFLALQKFVDAAHESQRPSDGYYVTLWRTILRYPELLAWEMLWTDSLRETYAAMHQKAKSIHPSLQIGWHIWHNNSFSPFYRAEQDLAEIAPYSDFLKIVMYNNCAGERIAHYIDNMSSSIFADIPKQELLEFHYRVLDYKEAPLDRLPFTGFSADYVYRETRRARQDLAGAQTRLWPGIDVDIPTAEGHSRCTPDGVRNAVQAALHGGSDGVLLSRKYSEMRLANLKGAGAAIRESGMA
jgi:hypothetical protein